MSELRIGSLCSGIGGLELGLERAGLGTTVWQCEYDPHASEVLARHWDVPNHGDVKATDWSKVEPVDVICAGYPCQPFSTAGRRQGTEDERHLWPAVRDAVGSLGPRLVILENVRGHLSLGQARDGDTRGPQGKRYLDPARSNNLDDCVDALTAGLLPTPTARDWKDGTYCENVDENALLGRVVWQLTGDRTDPPSSGGKPSTDPHQPPLSTGD